MEQVEPVQLPYEPRSQPKPVFKKKELRQSNRHRFDVALVSFAQFVLYVVISLYDARMRQPRVVVIFSTLWMLYGVMQLHDIIQRYRLAAMQWMARPGQRRILKYGVVLRVLGVAPSRRLTHPMTFIQSPSDLESAAQSPAGTTPRSAILVHSIKRVRKRQGSRATPFPISRRLQQLLGLGLLTIVCIAFLKDFQPTQHPVSSAFGMLFIAVFIVGAISLVADFGAACWHGCSAAGRSQISKSWIEYWRPRIETFEARRNDARV